MNFSCDPGCASGSVFFVAGTDTGVGKTVVCRLLLQAALQKKLSAGYYKPLSSGGRESPDLNYIQKYVPKAEAFCSYHFPFPASAHLAARKASKKIDLKKLDEDFGRIKRSKQFVVAEGMGGLLVPMMLEKPLYIVDLLQRWKLPAVVVARSGLGTLNHTLLTVEALRKRKIPIKGIVLNQALHKKDATEADNLRTLRRLLGLPVVFLPQLAPNHDGQSWGKKLWRAIHQG